MNKIALIFISILFVALLLGVTVVAIENITNATDNVTEDVIVEGVKIPTEIKKEDAESNIEYVSRKLDEIKGIIISLYEESPESVLLGNAEEHLQNAINAFAEMNYGESFGQSTSAKHLIDNVEKILNDEPLIEIFSFEESRPENNLVPENWFYSSINSDYYWKTDADLDEWETDKFSLSEDSYFGDISILMDARKSFCCREESNVGNLNSKTIPIDPSKKYYFEFYAKTDFDNYPYCKGSICDLKSWTYVFYFVLHFDSGDSTISELFVAFNETDIKHESLKTDFDYTLERQDVGDEWFRVKVEISSLYPSIDNARIEMSEHYEEQSGIVWIDDVLLYAG